MTANQVSIEKIDDSLTVTGSVQVRNPYINVEVANEGLERLCDCLVEGLNKDGIACEPASTQKHVSIAYAEGSTHLSHVSAIAERIAKGGFAADVSHFEFFEGQTTPYDYLVLTLHESEDFRNAVQAVEDHLSTRSFHGGFKSHVSLLRFEKGTASAAWARAFVRELNASHGAVFALGRRVSLEGHCVCVYSSDRDSVCRVACRRESAA